MKKNLTIALLSLSICLFSGCANAQKKVIPPVLVAVASRYKDIPAPKTFTSVPQTTYSFESSSFGLRFGTVKYEGNATLDQAINFYKEEMPKHKWALSSTMEYGNVLLNFTRENEICMVNLASEGDLVTITITLGPKLQQLLPK